MKIWSSVLLISFQSAEHTETMTEITTLMWEVLSTYFVKDGTFLWEILSYRLLLGSNKNKWFSPEKSVDKRIWKKIQCSCCLIKKATVTECLFLYMLNTSACAIPNRIKAGMTKSSKVFPSPSFAVSSLETSPTGLHLQWHSSKSCRKKIWKQMAQSEFGLRCYLWK